MAEDLGEGMMKKEKPSLEIVTFRHKLKDKFSLYPWKELCAMVIPNPFHSHPVPYFVKNLSTY